mmetsp:Transcript_35474/g.70386  ORF Transcript_35474/g.70386 Transcript_35474/m.70386 type:complete len:494 (-) Transcript_35474:59-1540(-)
MIKYIATVAALVVPGCTFGRATPTSNHGNDAYEPLIRQNMLNAPGASLATRWVDLLHPPRGNEQDDDGFVGGEQLRTALGLRQRFSVGEDTTIVTGDRDSQKGLSKRYLWCFLARDEAGLITQQRHLVECALLARRLRRTMLSPPLLVSGMDPNVWPRFWDELVNITVLGSAVKADLRSGRTAKGQNLNDTVTLDLHFTAEKGVPKWIVDFVKRHLGFKGIKKRRHGAAESLAALGSSALVKKQQTLFVAFAPDDSRDGASRRSMSRGTDPLVASLEPVSWLVEAARVMNLQLFGLNEPRYLAMTIVRGSDLAKCLQRPAPMIVADGIGATDEKFTTLVQLMRICFQGDSDVESIVSALLRRFGDMQVYLTGDEKSEDSLNFFQEHGYKTRLDAAVVRAHLRPTDAAFLDFFLCRNSTLFIGNSNSRISKQIVNLREAVDLPSFILKSADGADINSNSRPPLIGGAASSTRPSPPTVRLDTSKTVVPNINHSA